MLMQNDELHEVAAVFTVFNNSASANDDVAKAGETFLLALYGFNTCDSLDRLRYFTYSSKVAHHNLQTLQVFRQLLQPPDNISSVYSIIYNSG